MLIFPFTSSKLFPDGIIPPIPTFPSFNIVNTSDKLLEALKIL